MLYQTHALIHLENLKFNMDNIRKAIGNERKILLTVKAQAYGHGAVEVARFAEEIGVDWLAVATVPEAIELREAGVKLPILKLSHVFPEEMEATINADLSTAAVSIDNIIILNETAKKMGKKAKIHIAVDIGMGRIGVTPEDAWKLADEILHGCSNLELEGIFTHLPVSDESNKSFTQRQIEKFKKCVLDIEEKMHFKFPLVHCANSAAVLAHPEAWKDMCNMVRPGIIVYGYYPSNEVEHTFEIKPVLELKSKVSFIKKVPRGSSIGYGRTWVAPEECIIATIPIGYADGFNRLFSNTGKVLINGRAYPVVGRVCMDQIMCNLGMDNDIKIGDEVVLIGKSGNETISAEDWAKQLGTISYEVTSQINHRVIRYYTR